MLHFNVMGRYSSSGSDHYRLDSRSETVGSDVHFARRQSDQFDSYLEYDFAGWDGDEAVPISRETVEAARRLNGQLPRDLDRPEVAPGIDGTIGFQWRFARPGGKYVKIFIEVGPGAVVRAYRNNEGVTRHWQPRPIGYGAYRIAADVFSFLNDRT